MKNTRNNKLPQKGDKLFITLPNDDKWLPSGIDDIFKLSEGYRQSAISLYQEIKKSEWINKQYLSCAMIFSFRQFLEVRLKELIYFGKKELFEKPQIKNIHSLEDLYKTYIKEVLPKVNPTYNKNIATVVNQLVHEFNYIDPKSMNFRYPVDKDLNPSLTIQNFDIDNFKEVMDKLANYFDCQLELIQLLEDYNAEIAAEYASYICQAMY